MKKLLRILTVSVLAFGWLMFPSAESSPDLLTQAAADIAELNSNVGDLSYQTEFQSLISIAENKLADSKTKYTTVTNTSTAYDNAVAAEVTPLAEKTTAQTNKTNQQTVVDTAYTNYLNAELVLDIANINLSNAQQALNSAGVAGLQYDVYSLIRVNGLAAVDQFLCSGTLNSNSMQRPVCGNRYENFIVKFTGQITVPSWFTSTKFAGYTDDGFRMYVDGQLAVDNWVEQGATWSPYSPIYDVSVDKTLDVEIWWYNGGEVGSYHLGWAIPGGWTGAGCDYAGNPRVWRENFSCDLNTFSHGSGATQEQTNAYNTAYTAQVAATTVRDNKLTIYNTELAKYNSLVSVLNTKTTAYNNAVTTTQTALTAKSNAITAYNNSLPDLANAITDAFVYYEAQLKRELNIAIANAAAVQAAAELAKAQADAQAAQEARIQSEIKAKAEAEAKAAADLKAKQDAEAKVAAELKAKQEAETKEIIRSEAEAKAKAEAEEKARIEAERKTKAEKEKRDREQSEEKARAEEEIKTKQKAEAAAAAELKAKQEAEAKAAAELKAKQEAEAKTKTEAEEQAKKDAEERAKREAEAKSKAEAEAKENNKPKPEPSLNPEVKPQPRPQIKNEVLAALIPQRGEGTQADLSGIIANLTSKDNKFVELSKEQQSAIGIVKLNKEQTAAVGEVLISLTVEAKKEVAESLGIKAEEVAQIATIMQSSPEVATAFVEFQARVEAAAEAAGVSEEAMVSYTLADATTEVQAEAFLSDPLSAFTEVDLSVLSDPSAWGKDMTDDQRKKVQEVVIPMIIISNVLSSIVSFKGRV